MAAIVFGVGALIGLMLCFTACTKAEVIQPDELTVLTMPQAPDSIAQRLKSSTMNRMPNGGGEGTTDWLGTGIANGWHGIPGSKATEFSIASSHGNRAQCASSPNQFVLYSPTPAPISGVYHRLALRYTATTSFLIVVRYSDRCGYRIYEGTPSHEWVDVDVTFWAPKVVSVMFYNRPNEPGGIKIDQVNLF